MSYWWLEPLDRRRQNWLVRHAVAFQTEETAATRSDDSFVQDQKVTN